jgi:hypothetical protein
MPNNPTPVFPQYLSPEEVLLLVKDELPVKERGVSYIYPPNGANVIQYVPEANGFKFNYYYGQSKADFRLGADGKIYAEPYQIEIPIPMNFLIKWGSLWYVIEQREWPIKDIEELKLLCALTLNDLRTKHQPSRIHGAFSYALDELKRKEERLYALGIKRRPRPKTLNTEEGDE